MNVNRILFVSLCSEFLIMLPVIFKLLSFILKKDKNNLQHISRKAVQKNDQIKNVRR
jgi:hypothetical protein